MYSKSVLLSGLMAFILSIAGCEVDRSPELRVGNDPVGGIQVVVQDTIVFLPADSASAPVVVLVSDPQGMVMPGVRVEFSLSDSRLGNLEYVNPQLRDTTDSNGRIELIYRSFARAGDQLLTARSGGVTASRIIFQREADSGPYPFTLVVTPRELIADSNVTVEAHVALTITDESNRGVPNIGVIPEVTGGNLPAFPPTDSTGRTQGTWSFLNEFGDFAISVTWGALSATDTVHVSLRVALN